MIFPGIYTYDIILNKSIEEESNKTEEVYN